MIEGQELVKELANKYGRSREGLLPILQGIVEKEHFLSREAMLQVAEELDMSSADVYGTASFYSFLDTEPRGKYVIRVCKTITCDMHGKKQIVKTLEDMLKIKVGETTAGNRFTLLETNCLGWCHKGPVMLVNDEVFPSVTPEKAIVIVEEFSKKTK